MSYFLLIVEESNRYKSEMSEILVFIYTGLENVLTTMQISCLGQWCRESLSFQWWRVSVFSFIEVSTPSHEPSAKVNDCITSLLKSSKWVSSAFPFVSSCSQGHSAAEKAPEPDLPQPLYCEVHSVHFQNWLPSSPHMEINLSSIAGVI